MSLYAGQSQRWFGTRQECSPDTDEFDIDVDREHLLERDALLPSELVALCVHLVREWHLLVVTCWEQADFVNHARERARGICASGEPKYADLVTRLVYDTVR